MFQRIAIINRGEAAMRLIHAVREINAERSAHGQSQPPLTTIALYTDVEQGARFAREADEAYSIGPASERPYINHQLLADVLQRVRADAVWVGWGFVAEDPSFADMVERMGITFIGPSGESMRMLGDKIGSKLMAEEAGVPVAAWSRGGVESLDEALAAAERIGYPLMLKATAGGGGRGIRQVASRGELTDAYQRTRDEAERAFGSGVVFLEKLVTGARHIEIQVIADGHGTAWAIGVRDCTIQRRNQKILEESASPLLTDAQNEEVRGAAERLALAAGYQGAGTVEFLYQPASGEFSFLEVNTRLQVEHPITEITCDFDLVKAQIDVARGGRLQERPAELGHAVEARLNAEDPDRDFAPAPGLITRLDIPAGPGIRVDTGVSEGDSIPADFDSMIAKIIAFGRTRQEALARLRRALRDTTVIIDGGVTNKSFLLELLDRPEVIGSRRVEWADTGWIDRARAEGGLVADQHSGVALVAAAIEAYEEAEDLEVGRLLETAHGGRPQVSHPDGLAVDLKLRGATYQLKTHRINRCTFRVMVADMLIEADLRRLDDVHARLRIGQQTYRLVTANHGPIHLVEVEGTTHRVSRDEGGVLRSPAPALVVATPVSVGQEVQAGQPVMVLESMKMETPVLAPFAGKVKELLVMSGSQVESMAPLVRLEPIAEEEEQVSEAVDVDLPEIAPLSEPVERYRHALSALSAQLMGFDVDSSEGALDAYLEARPQARQAGVDVFDSEMALYGLFSDLAELSRNRPAGERVSTELRVHSDKEYFHTFLKSLDVVRAGVPQEFTERLARALRHYGITELDRTPAMEQAVFRIFLAQKKVAADADLVLALLNLWIHEPPPSGELAATAPAQLDRLKRATQRRFPAIADLARSVRFRWFDQPQVDAERRVVLAGVADEVEALSLPDAENYEERIDALAAIPERLADFLTARLVDGVRPREPLQEVLLRKLYGRYGMTTTHRDHSEGRTVAWGTYVNDGTVFAVATSAAPDELAPGGPVEHIVARRLQRRGTDDGAVVELYLAGQDARPLEEISTRLQDQLAGWQLPGGVRRIVVGIGNGDEVGYLTFRFHGDSLVEDERVRGLHPMIFRRLDLWRLENFDITRLPAPDGVLLFECSARSNPDDRRLVAMAEVLQLVINRDEDGRVVGVPHAERAIERCMEAVRRTRSARGKAGNLLERNHVWVHIWPAVDLDLNDVEPLMQRMTPLTDGTGIEEVLAHGTFVQPDGSERELTARFTARLGEGVALTVGVPPTRPLEPLSDYDAKVLRARRRGLVYPYELAATLAGQGGSLVELDLDGDALVEVDRPYGLNKAGIICARVTTPTPLHPEGVTRIVLCGDPTKGLGAVAEAECRRIIAALDLAERTGVPVEWFTVSSGARISMTSGVENMDWVGAALRRIVEFTQTGGEINVVVAGINVGAQPYWNAEATMLMHTRGILVMTPDSAMVLTGKQSLDFSGGVSAEDNHGIGGYDRVMGPNGQAQYWAANLADAFRILMRHYDHTWVAPGETAPRQAPTADPVDRDVSDFPHHLEGSDFTTVGQIFSKQHNPDRKKAFDIRTVIAAVCDQDHARMERWAGMADAETAVVMEARMGGLPVMMIGIESRPVPRSGFPPTDGPDTYTAGTLFPWSSKKVARAINAASGNRPVVVLANLSGFDGSPESMRKLQLEYGAEIGRAIVNFDGPIVFVVISRYHGGAFVVFSKTLNENMRVLAVEGSFASVIGGAPAAAVVFAGDVAQRTSADPKVAELEAALRSSHAEEKAALARELVDVRAAVRAEKINEVAAEFDGIHSIHRAVEVGSVDRVIDPAHLRPAIIEELSGG